MCVETLNFSSKKGQYPAVIATKKWNFPEKQSRCGCIKLKSPKSYNKLSSGYRF